MPSLVKYVLAAITAVFALCLAQTSTTCDPLDKTCSEDTGLSSSTFSTDFTTGSSTRWNTTAGSITYGSNGAEFIIRKEGDAPTIETDFYFFFGLAEVTMQAAAGTGIVSSIVLLSDDLDEVDWEALGGKTTEIETDYFGKGNTTAYDRATYVTVSTPQSTFHTYSVNWTSSSIEWLIDGAVVRTLAYSDAVDGNNFPQTPMRLKLGIWAGGDPDNSEGTIEWAGGETDYSDGPFTMYVRSVNITNYNPAAAYKYGDTSGSYQSIEIIDATNSSTTTTSKSNSTSTGSTTANSSAATSTTSTSVVSSAGLSDDVSSVAILTPLVFLFFFL